MTNRTSFLKRMMNALIDARERAVQRRIHQYLRGLSDRHLEDMGFSREQLERGRSAWPWRMPLEPHGTPMLLAAMRGHNSTGRAQPAESFSSSGSDDKLAA